MLSAAATYKPMSIRLTIVADGAPRYSVPAWSAKLAYAVGLIATDGNLASGGRLITFASVDRELVETFLSCLDRPNVYRTVTPRPSAIDGRVIGNRRELYFAQFHWAEFGRWLHSIGIAEAKSKTIERVEVPDEYFFHFVRGVLDGDGSIANYFHRPVPHRRPNYVYERLSVAIYSGSYAFVDWLRAQLSQRLGTRGSLYTNRHGVSSVSYGRGDSIRLLRQLYADSTAPCLNRKRVVWANYRVRHYEILSA